MCTFLCVFTQQVVEDIAESVTPITPNSLSKKGPKSGKRSKAVRKLHFDEDKSSPVSGTIIKDIGTVRDERNQLLIKEKYEETALGIQV